ncbi:hypothetical protein [Nocardia sp. NPDC003183]
MAYTETPRSRCEFYRHECSLPTVIDPDTGRITMKAGFVGAVMMPTELAHRVKTALDVRGVAPCRSLATPARECGHSW